MTNALQPVVACDILKKHPELSFREGPYSSQIRREPGQREDIFRETDT